MKQETCKSLFTLAGFDVLAMWELPNDYWPRPSFRNRDEDSRIVQCVILREESPWWLVKTKFGIIKIGWRKRVIEIDWSDTKIAANVTEDSVTKSDCLVHAWSEIDAAKYLAALKVGLEKSGDELDTCHAPEAIVAG